MLPLLLLWLIVADYCCCCCCCSIIPSIHQQYLYCVLVLQRPVLPALPIPYPSLAILLTTWPFCLFLRFLIRIVFLIFSDLFCSWLFMFSYFHIFSPPAFPWDNQTIRRDLTHGGLNYWLAGRLALFSSCFLYFSDVCVLLVVHYSLFFQYIAPVAFPWDKQNDMRFFIHGWLAGRFSWLVGWPNGWKVHGWGRVG